MSCDLSILIPSRNEMFLQKTIDDILDKARGNIEIVAVLDGAWADPPIKDDPRVVLIHYTEPIGQRGAMNAAAKLARGKYIAKCDAHCGFDEGFDVKLLADMQDNWTMVPVMRNLHAFDWVCENGHRRYQGPSMPGCSVCGAKEHREFKWIGKTNPQSDSYCFDSQPHFQYFREYRKRPEYKKMKEETGLTETMSLQGSFFLTTRDKYFELGLADENFGFWGTQGIEVAMKTRLSGGKCMVSHKTWYAHMFRTQGGDFSFPYPISAKKQADAKEYGKDLFFNNKWDKAIHPLSKVIDEFWPIPGWDEKTLSELKKKEIITNRSGIYLIKSLTNKRIYIGSAININNRIKEHIKKLKQNNHCNIHLQNTWNKYGENDLEFNVLYFCNETDLLKNEQIFMDEYRKKIGWNNMFNISPTAGSTLGIACSEETKQKISKSQMGKEAWNKGLTKETDGRVNSYAEKLNGQHTWENREHPRGMLGKTHTEETKQHLGSVMSNIVLSRERNENGQFVKTEEELNKLKCQQ